MSSGSVLPDEGVVGVYLHQGYDVEIHDSLAHCSKSYYRVAGNFGKIFRFGKFGKDHQIKILSIYIIALPDLNFSKLYQLSVNLMLTKVTSCMVCI